jgi:hypothetical protein
MFGEEYGQASLVFRFISVSALAWLRKKEPIGLCDLHAVCVFVNTLLPHALTFECLNQFYELVGIYT